MKYKNIINKQYCNFVKQSKAKQSKAKQSLKFKLFQKLCLYNLLFYKKYCSFVIKKEPKNYFFFCKKVNKARLKVNRVKLTEAKTTPFRIRNPLVKLCHYEGVERLK